MTIALTHEPAMKSIVERGSVNTQKFFCAEHKIYIRFGAVPKKHLVLDAKPSVCFSSGSNWLLKASCWRWKRMGPLPSLPLRLITRQPEPEVSEAVPGNQTQHSWASEVSLRVWEASMQVPGSWKAEWDQDLLSPVSLQIGSRDTRWEKEHMTIVWFMNTHSYKIQMELRLREKPMLSMTKAQSLRDCTPEFLHQDRTYASMKLRENLEIHLSCAMVSL